MNKIYEKIKNESSTVCFNAVHIPIENITLDKLIELENKNLIFYIFFKDCSVMYYNGKYGDFKQSLTSYRNIYSDSDLQKIVDYLNYTPETFIDACTHDGSMLYSILLDNSFKLFTKEKVDELINLRVSFVIDLCYNSELYNVNSYYHIRFFDDDFKIICYTYATFNSFIIDVLYNNYTKYEIDKLNVYKILSKT